jgi:hypothetical protein
MVNLHIVVELKLNAIAKKSREGKRYDYSWCAFHSHGSGPAVISLLIIFLPSTSEPICKRSEQLTTLLNCTASVSRHAVPAKPIFLSDMSGKFQSNCFGMSGLRLLTTPLVP